MRRLLIALSLVMLLGGVAQAQTTVNLSVVDTPDGQGWNNGTWSVQLIPGPGNLDQTRNFTLLVAGGSLGSQSGALSSTGTASMSLPANVNIGPVGTKWQFTVCSQQGTACSISNVTVVTSSPQAVALTPPSIRVAAAPNLPPIVVYTTTEISSASIGSQITLVGSTPSTPALQTCTAVSGSACTAWAVAGGISGSYGPLAFSCANCNPNVQYANAVTCNNLSTTIATGANDPPFTSGDVTKIIVGNSGGGAANCPPQGTITTFTDAHHVVVSVAATTTSTTGNLGWGSQDDGPNLRNAFLSSLGKGCLYLPAGNMFAGAAGSDSFNLFVDIRASTAPGFAPCVIGQGNTNITPLPSFNYANCVLNDACGYRFAQTTNSVPNYGLIKDWELVGLPYTLTGSGGTNFWINWQRTTVENVWTWNLGTGTNAGFSGAGPASVFGIVANGTGNTAGCLAAGTGGTSAGLNQIITIEQGFCQGPNGALVVQGNAAVKTKGMQFGSPTASGPTVIANSVWDSWGDGVFTGFGNTEGVRVNAGGFVNLNGDWVLGVATNTVGAASCNASGATLSLQNTTLDGGTAGSTVLRSVAGCNIRNNGNNKIVQGILSISGNNFASPSETQTGACTTNAATVTFKGTYIAAPLVLVSDSTSASTGAQVTATNVTTATIHCNGASDTFTVTVIPNPI